MTQETGPRTEIPRPQEKALELAKSIIKVREGVGEMYEGGNFLKEARHLYTSINQVESDALEALTDGERNKYRQLQGFANAVCVDPRRGAEIVKGLMETGGYTTDEIDSFFQTVESTKRYREAAGQ